MIRKDFLFKPLRAVQMDAARIPTASTSHDCGSLSRVVMVRKTDQRMINHKKPQSDPQCEFVTFETIQTYKGHRPDRTVVFTEKHDLAESEVQKSPSAQRFMRASSVPPSGAQTALNRSTMDLFGSHLPAAPHHRPGSSTSGGSSSASGSTSGKPPAFGGGSPLRQQPQPRHFGAAAVPSRPASSSGALPATRPFQSQPHLNNGVHTTNATTVTITSPIASRSTGASTPLQRRAASKSQSPVQLRKTAPAGSTDFERDCLRAHNEFRVRHGCAPLRLNRKLCRFAEEWARVIAARGTPAHRNNSPYGENIFCSWSSASAVQVTGAEPPEHWYDEGVNHVFGREPTTLKTGHFTQVVWRDSRELGVGMARNRSGQVFVVANYDPPGNFIGSFAENVPPLGGFAAASTVTGTAAVNTPKIMIESTEDDDSTAQQHQPQLLDSMCSVETTREVDLDRFVAAMLRHHNEFRRKHGAPELRLSATLRSTAQDWAETLAREDRFAYRPNSELGENIYCLWSSDRNAKANARNVCRSWYDEVREHTFGVEPKGAFRAGHFTQMVWRASAELGVGVAKTRKGKVLVVCNYNPRGNVIGEFCANVLRGR